MQILKVLVLLLFVGLVTPTALLKLKLPLLLLKKKPGLLKSTLPLILLPKLVPKLPPPAPPLPILKFHKYQGIDIQPVLPVNGVALEPSLPKTTPAVGSFLSGLGSGGLLSGLSSLGHSLGIGGGNSDSSDTVPIPTDEPSVSSPSYPSVPIPSEPQAPVYLGGSYSSSSSSYNPSPVYQAPAAVYGPPLYPPLGTYPPAGVPQVNIDSVSDSDAATSFGVTSDSSTEDPSTALAALDNLAPLVGLLPDENGSEGANGGTLAALSSLLPSGFNLGSLASLVKGAAHHLPSGPKPLPGFLAKKFAPTTYEFQVGKPYITLKHPFSSVGEDRQQVAHPETGKENVGVVDQIPVENLDFITMQQSVIPPQLAMVQYPSYEQSIDFLRKTNPTYNQDLLQHQGVSRPQRKSAQDRQGEEEIAISFIDNHSVANSNEAKPEVKSLQGGFEPSKEAVSSGQGYSKVTYQKLES